jgi:hypothetical protein
MTTTYISGSKEKDPVGGRIVSIQLCQIPPEFQIFALVPLAKYRTLNEVDLALGLSPNLGVRVGPPKSGPDLSAAERGYLSQSWRPVVGLPDPFTAPTDEMARAGVVGLYRDAASASAVASILAAV